MSSRHSVKNLLYFSIIIQFLLLQVFAFTLLKSVYCYVLLFWWIKFKAGTTLYWDYYRKKKLKSK